MPKVPKTTYFRNYHMTSKSGPNGHALATSLADLSLIRLNKRLLDSICLVGGPKLTERITGLLSQFDFLESCYPKYTPYRLRKLSYFSDKELKVRVIAILDY